MIRNRFQKMSVLFVMALLIFASMGTVSGVQAQSADEQDLESEPGVLIVSVRSGSPADKAGLVRGDVILIADGIEVNLAQELADVVLAKQPGDDSRLLVLHGGVETEVSVVLGERNGRTYLGVIPYYAEMLPPVPGVAGDGEAMEEPDVEQAPDDESADATDSEEEPAVEETVSESDADVRFAASVLEVVEESPAAMAGLAVDDVIMAVDGNALVDEEDLIDLIAQLEPGTEIELNIERDAETMTVDVVLGANPAAPDRAYLGVRFVPIPIEAAADADDAPVAGGDAADDDAADDDAAGEDAEEEEVDPQEMDVEPDLDARIAASIFEVLEGSPAEIAGLLEGDLITAVDGDVLLDEQELVDLIAQLEPGTEIELTVERDGQEIGINVVLAASPGGLDRGFLGIRFMAVPMIMAATGDGSDNQDEDGPGGLGADKAGEDDDEYADDDDAGASEESDDDGDDECGGGFYHHRRPHAMPHYRNHRGRMHPGGRMPFHHHLHEDDDCDLEEMDHGHHGSYMPGALDLNELMHYFMAEIGVDLPDDMEVEDLMRIVMRRMGKELPDDVEVEDLMHLFMQKMHGQ